jgi:hypothetical protein
MLFCRNLAGHDRLTTRKSIAIKTVRRLKLYDRGKTAVNQLSGELYRFTAETFGYWLSSYEPENAKNKPVPRADVGLVRGKRKYCPSRQESYQPTLISGFSLKSA